MSFFKSLNAASTKATTPNLGREITGDVFKRGKIQIVNNQAVIYGNETDGLIRQGYFVNSDYYAVARYIIRKCKRTKYYLYEVKDKKAFADFRQLKGEDLTYESLKKAELIKNKALQEASQPQIDSLLTKPNPEQNFPTFVEEAIAYRILTGERFIQIIPGLYPVSRLFVLPSTLMDVHAGPTYKSISKYVYQPSQAELKPEEVKFSKDFRPALKGAENDLRGLSPLQVLALSLQKSNEGKISSIRQYQNSGPPGVLSLTDDDAPLTPEQADMMEAKIRRKSGSQYRGVPHITGMKADWVQLGLSPVDLDILKSGVFDLRDFCRVLGPDSKLFGDDAASTYSNMAEARKAAIVDAVIPANLDLGDDLNDIIEPFNVKGKQYFVDTDVSGFPELAEDLNAVADRLAKLDLTPNEKREAMQYERLNLPLMDEPWFDNSKTPLSQFWQGRDDEQENDGSYTN